MRYIIDPAFFKENILELGSQYLVLSRKKVNVNEYGEVVSDYNKQYVLGSLQPESRNKSTNGSAKLIEQVWNFYCEAKYRIYIDDIIVNENYELLQVFSYTPYDEYGVRELKCRTINLADNRDLNEFINRLKEENGDEKMKALRDEINEIKRRLDGINIEVIKDNISLKQDNLPDSYDFVLIKKENGVVEYKPLTEELNTLKLLGQKLITINNVLNEKQNKLNEEQLANLERDHTNYVDYQDLKNLENKFLTITNKLALRTELETAKEDIHAANGVLVRQNGVLSKRVEQLGVLLEQYATKEFLVQENSKVKAELNKKIDDIIKAWTDHDVLGWKQGIQELTNSLNEKVERQAGTYAKKEVVEFLNSNVENLKVEVAQLKTNGETFLTKDQAEQIYLTKEQAETIKEDVDTNSLGLTLKQDKLNESQINNINLDHSIYAEKAALEELKTNLEHSKSEQEESVANVSQHLEAFKSEVASTYLKSVENQDADILGKISVLENGKQDKLAENEIANTKLDHALYANKEEVNSVKNELDTYKVSAESTFIKQETNLDSRVVQLESQKDLLLTKQEAQTTYLNVGDKYNDAEIKGQLSTLEHSLNSKQNVIEQDKLAKLDLDHSAYALKQEVESTYLKKDEASAQYLLKSEKYDETTLKAQVEQLANTQQEVKTKAEANTAKFSEFLTITQAASDYLTKAEAEAKLVEAIEAKKGELKGERGEPGAKGERGEQGPAGIQGVEGPRGLQGETGPQGQKGEQGVPGERGPQGLPGENAIFDPNNETFKQNVENYLRTNNSLFKGEPGERGPIGPQGAPGTPGERGEQGQVGPKGENGTPGAQGERGLTGPQGPAGQNATDEQVANKVREYLTQYREQFKGEQGQPGERGQTGPKGEPGNVGPAGPVGPRGETGAAGANATDEQVEAKVREYLTQHSQDFKGERGEQGVPGPTGPRGQVGPQGERGLPGEVGPQLVEQYIGSHITEISDLVKTNLTSNQININWDTLTFKWKHKTNNSNRVYIHMYPYITNEFLSLLHQAKLQNKVVEFATKLMEARNLNNNDTIHLASYTSKQKIIYVGAEKEWYGDDNSDYNYGSYAFEVSLQGVSQINLEKVKNKVIEAIRAYNIDPLRNVYHNAIVVNNGGGATNELNFENEEIIRISDFSDSMLEQLLPSERGDSEAAISYTRKNIRFISLNYSKADIIKMLNYAKAHSKTSELASAIVNSFSLSNDGPGNNIIWDQSAQQWSGQPDQHLSEVNKVVIFGLEHLQLMQIIVAMIQQGGNKLDPFIAKGITIEMSPANSLEQFNTNFTAAVANWVIK